HGGPSLAGPSPEVLIGPIASNTERIRVGSGGVMLPHYSPLKVAESFSVLSGLFPGRIDLALGRASGTDPLTTFALQRDPRAAAPAASSARRTRSGPASSRWPPSTGPRRSSSSPSPTTTRRTAAPTS